MKWQNSLQTVAGFEYAVVSLSLFLLLYCLFRVKLSVSPVEGSYAACTSHLLNKLL
jgi:hypothetical protein